MKQIAASFDANDVISCFFLGCLRCEIHPDSHVNGQLFFYLVWAKRVKNRDIKFTNGSLFSVAFGWLHHAKSFDNCLCFQGEKRHFAG